MSNPWTTELAGAVIRYERAIVEQQVIDGQRVLRVFPVDGTEILHDDGRAVPCWNALSLRQQRTLVVGHYGPDIREPEGDGCDQSATTMIETVDDESPGPRFYCIGCAIAYLVRIDKQ